MSRSPKLNGHVESFNGLLRREFFNFYRSLPGEIALLNEALQAFLQNYHHRRPHQALRFKTPAQCYNLPAPTDRVSLSHLYCAMLTATFPGKNWVSCAS